MWDFQICMRLKKSDDNFKCFSQKELSNQLNILSLLSMHLS